MSAVFRVDRIGSLPAGPGAWERTGLWRLVADAIASMFIRRPQDEQDAEQVGFSASRAQVCPFTDGRLREAFRRGREMRVEWEESAW